MMVFLSFDLSPTHVVGDVAQKSIPVLPSLVARLGGWFYRNERVQQYVPQVLIKYHGQAHKLLNILEQQAKEAREEEARQLRIANGMEQ